MCNPEKCLNQQCLLSTLLCLCHSFFRSQMHCFSIVSLGFLITFFSAMWEALNETGENTFHSFQCVAFPGKDPSINVLSTKHRKTFSTNKRQAHVFEIAEKNDTHKCKADAWKIFCKNGPKAANLLSLLWQLENGNFWFWKSWKLGQLLILGYCHNFVDFLTSSLDTHPTLRMKPHSGCTFVMSLVVKMVGSVGNTGHHNSCLWDHCCKAKWSVTEQFKSDCPFFNVHQETLPSLPHSGHVHGKTLHVKWNCPTAIKCGALSAHIPPPWMSISVPPVSTFVVQVVLRVKFWNNCTINRSVNRSNQNSNATVVSLFCFLCSLFCNIISLPFLLLFNLSFSFLLVFPLVFLTEFTSVIAEWVEGYHKWHSVFHFDKSNPKCAGWWHANNVIIFIDGFSHCPWATLLLGQSKFLVPLFLVLKTTQRNSKKFWPKIVVTRTMGATLQLICLVQPQCAELVFLTVPQSVPQTFWPILRFWNCSGSFLKGAFVDHDVDLYYL